MSRLLKAQKANLNLRYFLQNCVYTKDEHDKKNPVKKFPDFAYIEDVVNVWETEDRLLIKKSRQVLLTWIMVAIHTWLAWNRSNAVIIFQSDKEDKVKEILLDRSEFIIRHLSEEVKFLMGEVFFGALMFKFLKNGSRIIGTPAGADVIRSFTATAILSDEMAFQEKQEETLAGSLQSVTDGGKFTGISTIYPESYFDKLCEDLIKVA